MGEKTRTERRREERPIHEHTHTLRAHTPTPTHTSNGHANTTKLHSFQILESSFMRLPSVPTRIRSRTVVRPTTQFSCTQQKRKTLAAFFNMYATTRKRTLHKYTLGECLRGIPYGDKTTEPRLHDHILSILEVQTTTCMSKWSWRLLWTIAQHKSTNATLFRCFSMKVRQMRSYCTMSGPTLIRSFLSLHHFSRQCPEWKFLRSAALLSYALLCSSCSVLTSIVQIFSFPEHICKRENPSRHFILKHWKDTCVELSWICDTCINSQQRTWISVSVTFHAYSPLSSNTRVSSSSFSRIYATRKALVPSQTLQSTKETGWVHNNTQQSNATYLYYFHGIVVTNDGHVGRYVY